MKLPTLDVGFATAEVVLVLLPASFVDRLAVAVVGLAGLVEAVPLAGAACVGAVVVGASGDVGVLV